MTVPKAYVIQQPRHADNFDFNALRKLGTVEFILPAAPNIHDQERMDSDLCRMREIIRTAGASDVFVTMGGAPLSNMIFGKALALEGKPIRMGLYSRRMDRDGRRDQGGEYRVVTIR